jgi:hypothetical protein
VCVCVIKVINAGICVCACVHVCMCTKGDECRFLRVCLQLYLFVVGWFLNQSLHEYAPCNHGMGRIRCAMSLACTCNLQVRALCEACVCSCVRICTRVRIYICTNICMYMQHTYVFVLMHENICIHSCRSSDQFHRHSWSVPRWPRIQDAGAVVCARVWMGLPSKYACTWDLSIDLRVKSIQRPRMVCESMRTRLLVCVRGFGAARARVDRAYVPVRRTCVQQLRGAAHVGICLFPYKHVCMPLPAYMYVGLMFV